ncbi:NEL-type E3 ubiquitin ligase domain-containing protein [Pseudomonas koreensis]|uniref:NEL-type E3 ubiquitin ligase domain-containing protein n=1 Tax=Pseudomonas koreensis TaxID=198620 RepID=UPI003F84192D
MSTQLPPKTLRLEDAISANDSLHSQHLAQTTPAWLVEAAPARRAAMKAAGTQLPDWYQALPANRQRTLQAQVTAGFTAQSVLDKTMSDLESVETFAEALLVKALKEQFNVEVDVNKTLLCLKRPLAISVLEVELSSFEVLKLPLLQAALHNFEASECTEGAYHRQSGFVQETSTSGTFEAVELSMTVSEFLSLCRTLDVGARYQERLQAFLQSTTELPEQFIASQKAALRAAAELALLKKDIEPDDYSMILSVVDGEVHPRLGGKPVWFRDLSLMKRRMTGCVVFSVSERYRYTSEFIVYIPNDSEQPLKRCNGAQMTEMFKRRFTATDDSPGPGGTTAYQRFFSQFVAYAERPYYFSQFSEPAPDAPSDPLHSIWVKAIRIIPPISTLAGLKELPPETQGARQPVKDPYLNPFGITREGVAGIWSANTDLWQYLYEQHRTKLLADTRAHAVPTADADAKARAQKLAHLLEFGMLALNLVSMFVPVLGEIMMTVMAGQLLYESFEGAIEWSENDRQAAKAHLIDVAENLALIGVMAGVGKGLGKLTAIKAPPMIDALEPVTRPDGSSRLWKPDLTAYQSDVALAATSAPDAQGIHRLNGSTYIRLQDKVYQTLFDQQLKKWRILHPSDTAAYRPILEHNGLGAWRHSLERPLTWDRLTLLRRMGHSTEAFSDEQLLQIADVSGVGDDALRQMHLDNAPAPLPLADTLRLFDTEQRVARLIDQVERSAPLDEQYLLTLPLLTEMPRWPSGRALEVFDGPDLAGASVRYGAEAQLPGESAKAPIRLTRAEVLGGQMPARILAGLEEVETLRLLGAEPARVVESRPQEFSKQMADFLKTRQPALFERLYAEPATKDPRIALLQRLTPGLGNDAAIRVLLEANAEELARLDSSRHVPLKLLERSREYARQRRFDHALAGLHMEHFNARDSHWLALRALEKLPGWSGDVRLELREGGVDGPLLDSVGSEQAGQLKYLVKQGPAIQAFDEAGEALNSVTHQGDNFFASIMHALPDESRLALGFPGVGQSAGLRRAVLDQVTRNRTELSRLAGKRYGTFKSFKAPLRLSGGTLGYYASGRGQGVNPLLVTRVQDVYPALTDQQAGGFILTQMASGKSDAQIYELLQRRQREWQALESTLAEWEGDAAPEPALASLIGGKSSVVRNLKQSWHAAPLSEYQAAARRLDIVCDDPLPALPADFSHVRDLSVRGLCITDANADALLGAFPKLQSLRINATSESFSNLPLVLQQMSQLMDLTLYSVTPFADAMPQRLSQLTRLEGLTLCTASYQPIAFDVSRMRHLRRLDIVAYSLLDWPTGALDLPDLERLNLRDTGISSVPPGMLEGHEKIWSGLSLDWSRFSRESFKPAYEYVKTQPGHLVDREMMVRDYCRGELTRLCSGVNESLENLQNRFFQQWADADQRFTAIEALSEQYATLDGQLHEWSQRVKPVQENMLELIHRSDAARALRTNWRKGLFQRYGSTISASTLDLSGLMLSELPALPPEAFSHVRNLLLQGQRAGATQVRRFVSAFSGVQNLDLSDNALGECPIEPGTLPRLSRLNLAGNLLTGSRGLQQSLETLPALEHLDLHSNPLRELKVSGMSRLRGLNLQGTALHTWPAGAEALQQLTWLDLRDSRISTLPASVLESKALLHTNLTGAPLTPEAVAALQTAQQWIEFEIGLPDGALQAFAAEPVPADFPPAEDGVSVARHLLPLPAAPVDEGPKLLIRQLQRMQPGLSDEHAVQAIEQLRNSGLSEVETAERINAWSQTFDTLVRRLNGWLYTRETHGSGWVISSQSRSLAAWRILSCWRAKLPGAVEAANVVLDLNGLQLGDLPPLPDDFAHVTTLNLTGTRITAEGSDGFLTVFRQARALALNGNDLETLPQAIMHMAAMERLELSSNRFYDPEILYQTLSGLEQLSWLDLSYNSLESFDLSHFERLQTLDLSSNNLFEWPAGAFNAEHLQTLNLSRNDITTIPEGVFDGDHELLLDGTDLTDNYYLTEDTLERLRAYQAATGRERVLGLTHSELEEMVDELATGLTETTDSIESDELLPDVQAHARQKAPWLANLAPEELTAHDKLWDQLVAEPDSGAFFHLLERLQDTREFRVANADLTRRVWVVMEAAAANTELREILFAGSATHGTCVDGRILTFSGLESKVFTHNALLDLSESRAAVRGQALLALSRQLFRLDKVDELAKAASARSGFDEAEVRLGYRIGLTGGWEDGLELPGQPKNMSFASGVTPQQLLDARGEVLKAERSDRFLEDLIQRDYWLDFLKEQQPDAIRELDEAPLLEEGDDDALPADDPEYLSRLFDQTAARNARLIELTREEIERIGEATGNAAVAGSSKQPTGG